MPPLGELQWQTAAIKVDLEQVVSAAVPNKGRFSNVNKSDRPQLKINPARSILGCKLKREDSAKSNVTSASPYSETDLALDENSTLVEGTVELPFCLSLVPADDTRDKVFVAIVKALVKMKNTPSSPRELSNCILQHRYVVLGGATPYATVSSRISQHFKRAQESRPPRLPLLAKAIDETHSRKLRYYLNPEAEIPNIPAPRFRDGETPLVDVPLFVPSKKSLTGGAKKKTVKSSPQITASRAGPKKKKGSNISREVPKSENTSTECERWNRSSPPVLAPLNMDFLSRRRSATCTSTSPLYQNLGSSPKYEGCPLNTEDCKTSSVADGQYDYTSSPNTARPRFSSLDPDDAFLCQNLTEASEFKRSGDVELVSSPNRVPSPHDASYEMRSTPTNISPNVETFKSIESGEENTLCTYQQALDERYSEENDVPDYSSEMMEMEFSDVQARDDFEDRNCSSNMDGTGAGAGAGGIAMTTFEHLEHYFDTEARTPDDDDSNDDCLSADTRSSASSLPTPSVCRTNPFDLHAATISAMQGVPYHSLPVVKSDPTLALPRTSLSPHLTSLTEQSVKGHGTQSPLTLFSPRCAAAYGDYEEGHIVSGEVVVGNAMHYSPLIGAYVAGSPLVSGKPSPEHWHIRPYSRLPETHNPEFLTVGELDQLLDNNRAFESCNGNGTLLVSDLISKKARRTKSRSKSPLRRPRSRSRSRSKSSAVHALRYSSGSGLGLGLELHPAQSISALPVSSAASLLGSPVQIGPHDCSDSSLNLFSYRSSLKRKLQLETVHESFSSNIIRKLVDGDKSDNMLNDPDDIEPVSPYLDHDTFASELVDGSREANSESGRTAEQCTSEPSQTSTTRSRSTASSRQAAAAAVSSISAGSNGDDDGDGGDRKPDNNGTEPHDKIDLRMERDSQSESSGDDSNRDSLKGESDDSDDNDKDGSEEADLDKQEMESDDEDAPEERYEDAINLPAAAVDPVNSQIDEPRHEGTIAENFANATDRTSSGLVTEQWLPTIVTPFVSRPSSPSSSRKPATKTGRNASMLNRRPSHGAEELAAAKAALAALESTVAIQESSESESLSGLESSDQISDQSDAKIEDESEQPDDDGGGGSSRASYMEVANGISVSKEEGYSSGKESDTSSSPASPQRNVVAALTPPIIPTRIQTNPQIHLTLIDSIPVYVTYITQIVQNEEEERQVDQAERTTMESAISNGQSESRSGTVQIKHKLLRRVDSGYVNATTLLEAGGMVNEQERSIVLSLEVGRIRVRKQGSDLMGTWIPLMRARALAATCSLPHRLGPFLNDNLESYFPSPLPIPRPHAAPAVNEPTSSHALLSVTGHKDAASRWAAIRSAIGSQNPMLGESPRLAISSNSATIANSRNPSPVKFTAPFSPGEKHVSTNSDEDTDTDTEVKEIRRRRDLGLEPLIRRPPLGHNRRRRLSTSGGSAGPARKKRIFVVNGRNGEKGGLVPLALAPARRKPYYAHGPATPDDSSDQDDNLSSDVRSLQSSASAPPTPSTDVLRGSGNRRRGTKIGSGAFSGRKTKKSERGMSNTSRLKHTRHASLSTPLSQADDSDSSDDSSAYELDNHERTAAPMTSTTHRKRPLSSIGHLRSLSLPDSKRVAGSTAFEKQSSSLSSTSSAVGSSSHDANSTTTTPAAPATPAEKADAPPSARKGTASYNKKYTKKRAAPGTTTEAKKDRRQKPVAVTASNAASTPKGKPPPALSKTKLLAKGDEEDSELDIGGSDGDDDLR